MNADRFSQGLVKALAVACLCLLAYGYFQPHIQMVEAEKAKVKQLNTVLQNAYSLAGRDTTSQVFKYLRQFAN